MRESSPEQPPKPEVLAEQHEQANFVLRAIGKVKQLFAVHKDTKYGRFADYHGLERPGRVTGGMLEVASGHPEIQGTTSTSDYQTKRQEQFKNFREIHDLPKPLRVGGGTFPSIALLDPKRFKLVKGVKETPGR